MTSRWDGMEFRRLTARPLRQRRRSQNRGAQPFGRHSRMSGLGALASTRDLPERCRNPDDSPTRCNCSIWSKRTKSYMNGDLRPLACAGWVYTKTHQDTFPATSENTNCHPPVSGEQMDVGARPIVCPSSPRGRKVQTAHVARHNKPTHDNNML